MQIYNARYADNNQRFIAAMIAGLVSAVILGLAFGALKSVLMIIPSVLLIAIGYAIAYVIRYTGRGIHRRFMILGAIMTLLAIIIGDTSSFTGVGTFLTNLFSPQMWAFAFRSWFATYLSANINSLLGLVIRGIAVYCGYMYSVVF